MQKAKLDVLVVLFCYSGNGGYAAVIPDIAVWFAKRYMEMSNDERIGRVGVIRAGDVPLTAERNRVVKKAKDEGFDVIVMLDSDNIPDLYLGHVGSAQPFWSTSFDFLYDRAMRGIPTVVCAPYCGPPPHPVTGGCENVYVFYCEGMETTDGKPDMTSQFKFEAYSREHAALMTGIKPVAAGPTGVILYSTDAFDLMPIRDQTDEEVLEDFRAGTINDQRALQLLRMRSWFYYEYTDQWETGKASTEDVVNLREIQMAGTDKHGEPVVFCNWDAWAGHAKQKIVGKPAPLRVEQISPVFAEAVLKNRSVRDELVELDLDPLDDEQWGDNPEVARREIDEKVRAEKWMKEVAIREHEQIRRTTPEQRALIAAHDAVLWHYRDLEKGRHSADPTHSGLDEQMLARFVSIIGEEEAEQLRIKAEIETDEIPTGEGPPEYDDLSPMVENMVRREHEQTQAKVASMRLGKVFSDPQFDENTCELLRSLVGQSGWGAKRSIVIGDKTGELCHAVHWDEDCATYAMDVGPEFSANGARLLDEPRKGEGNLPFERAASLATQDLDAVIFGDIDDLVQTNATAWSRHVRPGGALIIVDSDDSADFSHILDPDAFDYRQVEGTGIHAFIKHNAPNRMHDLP